MIQRFLIHFSNRFVSRYLVLASDILIVIVSLVVAYIVRFNFDLTDVGLWKLPTYLPIVVGISVIAFLVTRSYVGIIRHTSTDDVIRIFKAVLITALALVLLNTIILLYHWPIKTVLPLSIIIIHSLLVLFLMIFTRLFARLVWINLLKGRSKSTGVLIYGAGKAGILTKNALINDLDNDYNVVCFIDENPGKIGKSMEGIPVHGPEVLNKDYVAQKKISQVIIAIQNIDPAKKRQIADICLKFNVVVKNIPPVESWINGELQASQIRNIRIEDLLQREPIVLDNSRVVSENQYRVILVTGAAGSIGSEIARQLMPLPVRHIILLDQAETPLHDLTLEFRQTFPGFSDTATPLMADVSDAQRMEWVFGNFRPNLVYHAAAYKHVPMMEENPVEAVRVNVFGTRLLADLAIKHRTERFVMVSTDKAVHASSVMGATKRIAEIYTQSLSAHQPNHTRFITTRFGNVLGSSGSVIPLFQKQISEGGPVTVTHPDVVRYFMTIPEACELVLEAGTMGNGGEIYMFDMGQPVRIVDLARNMIRLAGRQPDEDIRIVYSGLRPGEKLFEELLNTGENTIPTHHPRILIAKVNPADHRVVIEQLKRLEAAWKTGDDFEMVRRIKDMVPDFISNNSIYEALDKP
jgi:FlaA1/EpsC-like NDP-sugar epimerase